MTEQVLCGDARELLGRLAAEVFPGRKGRVLGKDLLQAVRELALERGRIHAILETARYAPTPDESKTGQPLSDSERVERMAKEHSHLVGEWSRRTFAYEARPPQGVRSATRPASGRSERALAVQGGQA